MNLQVGRAVLPAYLSKYDHLPLAPVIRQGLKTYATLCQAPSRQV